MFIQFSWLVSILVAVLAPMLFIAIFFLVRQTLGRNIPRAWNVAVIGFPKAGKTTLITRLFGELFAGKLKIQTIIRGKTTIEKINEDLRRLEVGRNLGPTTDQDLFAYRTDITLGQGILKKTYKIQIGDFPGEASEKLAYETEMWFHDTEFFKWVMEADAFLFVVDLAPMLDYRTNRDYVARVKSAIRAAWQHIEEYYSEGKTDLRYRPVGLVFTKADLFAHSTVVAIDDDVIRKIERLGFGDDKVFFIKPLTEDELKEGGNYTKDQFEDLISYLNTKVRKMNVIFTSSFSYFNGERLGIKETLETILPS
ncbi:GTPase domain-containing protein [Candidatus Acetothermia bacterium]|nr:GTPase domain-containing protein [Candidatus Acetothermia bacterium]MBI3643679.1 GTPase domain-containing protein [Candidatus Acetothermia bacterium]